MAHALFQVALKVLLRKDDKILVLTTPDNYVDFPGGRIDSTEMDAPFDDALRRELEEEIGGEAAYEVGNVAFVCKRYYTANGQDHRIVAVYYEVAFTGGVIELSDEHTQYEWRTPESVLPLKDRFVSADEYEQFARYVGSTR